MCLYEGNRSSNTSMYRENHPHVKCLANIFAKFFPSKITTFTVYYRPCKIGSEVNLLTL